MICSEPDCNNIAERNGICASHNFLRRKAEMDSLKQKKVNKPIAKRSDKMKETMKTYHVLRKVFLKSKGKCEAVLPGCNGRPETVHHKIGRGINILNVKTWLACCFSCHVVIELNPDFAKENGFSESRLSKK